MTRTHKGFLWPDEAVDKLIAMYKEGRSARQIAIALGHGLTRNAIIGKWERLRKAGLLPALSDKVITLKLTEQRLTPATLTKMRTASYYVPPPKPQRMMAAKLFVFPKANINVPKVVDRVPAPVATKPIPDNKFTPLDGTSPRPLVGMTRGCCRWPVGEDLFCCEPVDIMTERPSSYCPTHRKVSRKVA